LLINSLPNSRLIIDLVAFSERNPCHQQVDNL
jgi:hypothetical protein